MSESWEIFVQSEDPIFSFALEDTESGERVANIYHANMELAHLFKSAPKMRDALNEAFEFVKSEYYDAEADALEGSPIAREARPVWDAICDALGGTQSWSPFHDEMARETKERPEEAKLSRITFELREALRSLANTASGFRYAEDEIRAAVGNTNWGVLQHHIHKAREVLAKAERQAFEKSEGENHE